MSDEPTDTLRQCNHKASPGPDNTECSLFLPNFNYIFMLSLSMQRVPTLCKESIVIPVAMKEHYPKVLNDDRPVAPTFLAMKSFEKTGQTQYLFDPFQFSGKSHTKMLFISFWSQLLNFLTALVLTVWLVGSLFFSPTEPRRWGWMSACHGSSFHLQVHLRGVYSRHSFIQMAAGASLKIDVSWGLWMSSVITNSQSKPHWGIKSWPCRWLFFKLVQKHTFLQLNVKIKKRCAWIPLRDKTWNLANKLSFGDI